MLADICDLDEMRSGRLRTGVYFGFFSFLVKAAGSVPVWIHSRLLSIAKFDETLEYQSEETITMLRLILMWGPLVLVLLSAFILIWYPLSASRMEEIQEVLEERRGRRMVG